MLPQVGTRQSQVTGVLNNLARGKAPMPPSIAAVLLKKKPASHRSTNFLGAMAGGKKSMSSLPCISARCLVVQVDGSHDDEQICGGKMGEKEKQSGSCAVERRRNEEIKAVKSRLMLGAYMPTGVIVMSGLGYCYVPCLGPWSYSN